MVQVKICGLRRLVEAEAALDGGAAFLGFIFYPPSPRYLMPEAGAELTWRNPQLVGALAAIAASALTRRPLLTIAIGLTVFFVWQCVVLR